MQPGASPPRKRAWCQRTGFPYTQLQCSRGVSAPETASACACGERWRRFNAAGASPPRKLRWLRRVPASLWCFNAAGASPPRETGGSGQPRSDGRRLQCSRGVSAPETETVDAIGGDRARLQCSRGVSAPETSITVSCHARMMSLQCSRGVSAPETRFATTRRPSARCFNAAGASPPRKPAGGHRYDLRQRASMQPGRLRPGNAGGPEGRERPHPGFNAAGASPPRKRNDRRDAPNTDDASMQPGRLRPGNLPGFPHRGRGRLASMQPGRLRPGNVGVPEMTRVVVLLQCSRGVSAPETSERYPATIRGPKLQCSRGRLRPGNFTNHTMTRFVPLGLQCSRGVSAPETHALRGAPVTGPGASMQPGRLRPGNRAAQSGRERLHPGFNAAGASPPRKRRW